MRQLPHLKRPRGGRSSGRRGQSQRGNRTFESNGPSVKVRGNANQLFEKYQALARDANTSGDRVAAENYLQHAEHYYRVLTLANGNQQRRPGNGQARPDDYAAAQPAKPQALPEDSAQAEPAKTDGGNSGPAPA